MVVPPPNQNPPLQFSILRLAFALGLFTTPIAFVAGQQSVGIMFAVIAAAIIATLSLLAARKSNLRYINLFALTAIGGICGVLIRPELVNTAFSRVTQESDILFWFVLGAALGSIIGCIWNLATRAN